MLRRLLRRYLALPLWLQIILLIFGALLVRVLAVVFLTLSDKTTGSIWPGFAAMVVLLLYWPLKIEWRDRRRTAQTLPEDGEDLQ